MRSWFVALVLLASPAMAADRALILNDQEQAALRQSLDAAIRANGLSPVSRNAMILSDKLDQAGVVTQHTDTPDDKPKGDDNAATK